MTTEERFWSKIQKTDSCWLWTGGKTNKGYGALYQGARKPQLYTHRYSWQLHFGDIPNKLWVLHKCDVRNCVRPDHLFLGTPLQNALDGIKKGRMPQNEGNPEVFKKLWKGSWSHRRGVGHEGHKLSEQDVITLRTKYRKGVYGYVRLSKEFQIHPQVVKRIVLRKSWKHLADPE